MKTFYELGLSNQLIRAITDMGFEAATPIQAETIPKALAGKDLIGQAQTGTGKTAAFGVPLIELADMDNPAIQALVVAPTRELAIQVAEEINRLGQLARVRALPIYGGQEFNRQIRALKNRPNIIVGTPGRLLDHIRRKTIRLDQVRTIVLDEADEMLQMGFIEDIELILQELPEERQTLLFSATMPPRIKALAEKFMHEPEFVKITPKEVTVANIDQFFMEVHESQKFDALCRLLDLHSPELAIVFGRTKRRVDELAEALSKRGYDAEGIHGDLTQSKRESVLRKFREKTVDILVATDVAARGLDVSGVSHVYNFDVPQDPESYVHRIGRTGRAGNAGMAITFVTPREFPHLRTIESITQKRMTRQPMPNLAQVLEGIQEQTVEDLLEILAQEDHHDYLSLARQLTEDHDALELLAAAFKLLVKEPDTTPVKLTAEAPLRVKTPYGGKKDSGSYKGRRNFSRDGRDGRRDSGSSNRSASRRDSSSYRKDSSRDGAGRDSGAARSRDNRPNSGRSDAGRDNRTSSSRSDSRDIRRDGGRDARNYSDSKRQTKSSSNFDDRTYPGFDKR